MTAMTDRADPGNDVEDGAQRDMPIPAVGSVVVVRDEEWLVETVGLSADGWRLTCRGLSELVRDTTATFLTELEPDLEVLDPANARMVADDSPGYRRSRLWVEAMLRKTPVPLHTQGLTVVHRMLLDPLTYQRKAVRKALDPAEPATTDPASPTRSGSARRSRSA